MGRKSKRARPIPADKDEKYAKIVLNAKTRAYELLLCSILRRGSPLSEEDVQLASGVYLSFS
jgi:hypothetical protein